MKKIFTLLAAMLVAASMSAQFGIAVNGAMYYQGTENPNPQDPSFREYMVLGLQLHSGDYCQLCDAGSNYATWAVDLDGASVSAISRNGDKYSVSVDGCYDFYIKIKNQNDQLYVGAGDCGSPTGTPIGGGEGGGQGQGGEGQGGGDTPDEYWYWKGYVDGGDITNEEGGFNIFVGGKSDVSFETGGYLFVMHQIKGVPGTQYMAVTYTDGPTHATMTQSGTEKLHVPAGDHTLYLYDNEDGTVELSYVELQGKKLMGGGEGGGQGGGDNPGGQGQDAVDNVTTPTVITKTIENGQVVIIKNGIRFNLLGAQLH